MGDSEHRNGILAVITLILFVGIGLIAWGLIDEFIQMWTYHDWWWPYAME